MPFDCNALIQLATFVSHIGVKSTWYFQQAFPKIELKPNEVTGEIKLRFNQKDFATLNEANDFSYLPFKVNAPYETHTKMTAHYKGELVFGEVP